MMPNAAERQARALESIKGYMHDLVKVMTAVNENLVEFSKIYKDTLPEPPDWAKKEGE